MERFATIVSGGSEAGHSTEGELTAGIFGVFYDCCCVVFVGSVIIFVVFRCRDEFIAVSNERMIEIMEDEPTNNQT